LRLSKLWKGIRSKVSSVHFFAPQQALSLNVVLSSYRRDTLTRHTRLHQRDDVSGSLKLALSHALGDGDDDETSEDFTTPSGSKQVSPATSSSTAAPPSVAVPSTTTHLTPSKAKKSGGHSRSSSNASQKTSRRGSSSKAPASMPSSKKNTPEYKPAGEDHQPAQSSSLRGDRPPRRAAAAALYDENALMDEEVSSEQDEMQEDSPADQDAMIVPADAIAASQSQPVKSALSASRTHVPVVKMEGTSGHSQRIDDMIKPLLPSLHTSSFLTKSLEAAHQSLAQQQQQAKPLVQGPPVPASAVANLNQPLYSYGAWDQNHTYAQQQQHQAQLIGNPALLGYSSSANSSGSSSGSTYSSGQMGSAGSLTSPYSMGTTGPPLPGSALGLDLGLPPSPPLPISQTPDGSQHFQGYNNFSNPSLAAQQQQQQQQNQYRIPPYSPQQQQQRIHLNSNQRSVEQPPQQQQPFVEGFPIFQGPNSFNKTISGHTSVNGSDGGRYSPSCQPINFLSNVNGTTQHNYPLSRAATTAANADAVSSSGPQGYPNQSSSAALQSFLASGAGSPNITQFSQRESLSMNNNGNNNRHGRVPVSAATAPSSAGITIGSSKPTSTVPSSTSPQQSFVPSFWAHMTVQHHDLPPLHPIPCQTTYSQLHHRSSTSRSYSPTEDFEVRSTQSDISSPASAASLLGTSPTLTAAINLAYSTTSPGSDISSLPSLSSSFTSAFSGDFFNGTNTYRDEVATSAAAMGNNPLTTAFKYRNSFMEPFNALDEANSGVHHNPTDMNAILKAADAHTDQVS
jgi:hypothetical protein